jgi:hypothetical protein
MANLIVDGNSVLRLEPFRADWFNEGTGAATAAP